VCRLGGRDGLDKQVMGSGARVWPLGLRRESQWLRGACRLARVIRRERIDLVHTTLYNADLVGALAGVMTRRPVVSSLVTTAYGPEWLADNPGLSRSKLKLAWTMRSVVGRCLNSRLIANSRAVKEVAVKHLGLPDRKISVVNRGIGPEWFTPPDVDEVRAVRDELGLNGASPVLLNVARLVPAKGQRYLLEAMPAVVARFPQSVLLIAGETKGGEASSYAELIELRQRLKLEDHVRFLDKRADVKSLLHAADMGVFSSLYEGFGNALAEACATGRPCVATRIGGFEEIVAEAEVSCAIVRSNHLACQQP
jgi:glycosyltransferase involved in cell wall biosynthesis